MARKPKAEAADRPMIPPKLRAPLLALFAVVALFAGLYILWQSWHAWRQTQIEPELMALRDLDEEDPAEIEASKFDLAYVQLDGDIGCLVNGAGLAMATMDIIKLYGGSPANFLDVGGGASAEKVTEAFKIMLKNPKLAAILVNIFGGIMKCDVIATGVVQAARQVALKVPLVVRLEGTNVELGKKILAESGLPIISGTDMADAAEKVVKAVKGGRA